MKLVLLAVVSLILISMGCLASPLHEHMCPDGTIVKAESECSEYTPEIINLDPDDYASVTLEENKTYYVKSNGQLTAFVEIVGDEEIVFGGWERALYTSLFDRDTDKRPKWVKDNIYIL